LARRSLKPQLNQIRTWVKQGRTDAWIAHQLEVSAGDIRGFKREHGLVPEEAGNGEPETAMAVENEEPDLRAEDDALVAAALDAEPEETEDEAESEDGEDGAKAPARRRGRRGGRSRRSSPRGGGKRGLEGTFDHGDEGYGLWLDPAVQDDPVYAEHWAGHRPVTVTIEQDQIVIRRAGEQENGAGEPAAEASEPEADAPELDPDRFDA
jgi:hypothetical protein